MANKDLFKSTPGQHTPAATTTNAAGGAAYLRSDEAALAQYAATGCLNQTFYATAEEQLERTLALAALVSPEYLARIAVYARERGRMKDMPALLLAVLSTRDTGLMQHVFNRVITNGKMLRNFVQIMRSGVVGRKSLGSAPRNLVQAWLQNADEYKLLDASVGNDPSLADVVKMVHPKPTEPWRNTWFAWLIGKSHDPALLPERTALFEAFKADMSLPAPDVPFQMLTGLPLTDAHWTAIARTASWQQTRMNLNTFQRHNVFADAGMTMMIADRLRNPELVRRAAPFPYQLLAAYMNVGDEIPFAVRDALQDVMELAIDNVPVLPGKTVVMVDISGSMSNPVTGHRKGATSKMRNIDVAGLMAASILRKNPDAMLIAFNNTPFELRLNPRDTVMTNTRLITELLSGGTSCSAPVIAITELNIRVDNVIMISDNESWVDMYRDKMFGTSLMNAWNQYRARVNDKARMVLIDISPSDNTQVVERDDVLNIGGFSDDVFTLTAAFARGDMSKDHWADEVRGLTL